ncbi:MAG: hypothetical protein ACLFR1_05650 [Spirochaetia bacterium]
MKISKMLFVLIISMLLTGCLDVLQSVDESNGVITVRYRITLSKSISAMAESMGGSDGSSPEEDFSSELGLDEIEQQIPEGIDFDISEIDTPHDMGVDVIMRADRRQAGQFPQWFPRITNTMVRIPLFPSNSEDPTASPDPQEAQFAEALLGSRKYRLIISQDICPPNPEFLLAEQGGRELEPIEGIELGDVYLIEIPLMLWFTPDPLELRVQ